ncbi:MAG1210 family protein [Acholeplasma granularum]|uniref:MAG1210 family protein n=1 Tax=Acholeplasma granularum TaxID=264635 RepID=UPI00046E8587|nr:hypothetical protein [Acholeplasma granularum]
MAQSIDQDQIMINHPLDEYKNIYKSLHEKHVSEKLDSLILKSGVNVDANRLTVKDIKAKEKVKENLSRSISKKQGLKSFLIFLMILLVVAMIISIYQLTIDTQSIIYWSIIPASVILFVVFIFIIKSKLNPVIKSLKADKQIIVDKIKLLYDEAWAQMAPLNNSFYEGISQELFQQTIPLIKMDAMFDSKRLDYLVTKFGLDELEDYNRSTLYVQSGDLKGNPYYIAEDLVHKLGTKTYTGSITIHWTTTSTVNGRTVTNHHSQVLSASITKPYPYYTEQSYLVYGNDAAPDLIFSRQDSDAENMSEKQIDKHVNKSIKKLEKKSRKSLSQGTNYTVFGNSEFEVLFNAIDRNHEVQFRLLFTPLAQTELLELMKDKNIGFGDDFNFIKHKKINIVIPEQLSTIKLNMPTSYYSSYDIDDIIQKFKNYQNAYFKHIYFAFAPLLAIPLYQQTVTQEYIYKDLYDSYVSFFEHERIVNNMDINQFKHSESVTRNILKTSVSESKNAEDIIKVTAYGYKSIPRISYETRLGRDGRMHTIPIPWDEYIPVEKSSEVNVKVNIENKPLTHAERVKQIITDLKDKKIDTKDLFIMKNFVATILNDKKNDKIKETKGIK